MNLSIIIPKEHSFNPAFTFECGQVFRWNRLWKKRWEGIVAGSLVRVDEDSISVIADSENRSRKETEDVIWNYFSLSDDFRKVSSTFPSDEYLRAALQEYPGLRLLAQDPWECLISFVCSINSNIPSIRLKIENLCSRFGKKINRTSRAFPPPKSLAFSRESDLLECKVGFRWKYIKQISQVVVEGRLDLEGLRKLRYNRALKELVSESSGKTFGVGPKVADCVLLFSLGKFEAFPIDVWMLRCINDHYPDIIQGILKSGSSQITPAKYYATGDRMREYFGEFAGYAQQYLYMKTRSDGLTRGKERA